MSLSLGWSGRAIILILLAAAGMAHAQDNMLQGIYAGLQDNIRNEYEFHLTQAMRQLLGSGAPPPRSSRSRSG